MAAQALCSVATVNDFKSTQIKIQISEVFQHFPATNCKIDMNILQLSASLSNFFGV